MTERLRDLRRAAQTVPGAVWTAWAATALAFLPIYKRWVGDWFTDPNYSQGFLVPLIAVYLGARELQKRLHAPARDAGEGVAWTGLAICLAGFAAYLLGTGGAEDFTTRTGFILTLLGATWWLGGRALGASLAVPILFLLFSVPIPAVLYCAVAVPMQSFAAAMGAGLLHIIGVPVAREGNSLLLPGMALEVAEACSGIRSLTVLLALSALWAYLLRGRAVWRLLIFAAAVPLAILGNGVRVFLVAMVAYLSNAKAMEGTPHEVLGFVVFLVTLTGLHAFSRLLGHQT
jgi:exosortase